MLRNIEKFQGHGQGRAFRNVDLKQIDCQLFLQQKCVYSQSTKTCNLGSVTMASHTSSMPLEDSYREGKRKLEGL